MLHVSVSAESNSLHQNTLPALLTRVVACINNAVCPGFFGFFYCFKMTCMRLY